jgi:hypothetical protein
MVVIMDTWSEFEVHSSTRLQRLSFVTELHCGIVASYDITRSNRHISGTRQDPGVQISIPPANPLVENQVILVCFLRGARSPSFVPLLSCSIVSSLLVETVHSAALG